jgi:hypothetical protein
MRYKGDGMNKKQHLAELSKVETDRTKWMQAFLWSTGKPPEHVTKHESLFDYPIKGKTYRYGVTMFFASNPLIIVTDEQTKYKAVYYESEVVSLIPGDFEAYLLNTVQSLIRQAEKNTVS